MQNSSEGKSPTPIFDAIKHAIDLSRAAGNTPMVVFDVDDTLIDCRHRKSLVFHAFAREESTSRRWPDDTKKLSAHNWETLKYRVHDNLHPLSITDKIFGDELLNYWLKHYFTYPYLIQDRAFPGAQAFVKRCLDRGAHIMYLTARDHPGMYQGTVEALESLGFPIHKPNVHVMLKPEASQSDHHFKVGALEDIAALGEVIASFENELPNLNAMAERFPNALMIWRKTLYAPDPPPPHSRVQIMDHFPPS
ncbi:MAG: HAD family hydrolase [Proteobacteria bacterium]|nr:MAG: HAD family hydrolase [Pseudomonadota bacterium]